MKQIDQALDLTPIDNILPAVSQIAEIDPSTPDVQTDFEYARGNMIAAIEKGQEALSNVLDVAGMSQQPRAYEVAAKLVDSLVAANKDLLVLSKQRQELSGSAGQSNKPTTVNNNLFVGTTADLQKLIKQQNEN